MKQIRETRKNFGYKSPWHYNNTSLCGRFHGRERKLSSSKFQFNTTVCIFSLSTSFPSDRSDGWMDGRCYYKLLHFGFDQKFPIKKITFSICGCLFECNILGWHCKGVWEGGDEVCFSYINKIIIISMVLVFWFKNYDYNLYSPFKMWNCLDFE